MIDVCGFAGDVDMKKVKEYASEYYNSSWDHRYEFIDIGMKEVCENIHDDRWFHSRIKGFVKYFIEREWNGERYSSYVGYSVFYSNLQELCDDGLFL